MQPPLIWQLKNESNNYHSSIVCASVINYPPKCARSIETVKDIEYITRTLRHFNTLQQKSTNFMNENIFPIRLLIKKSANSTIRA